MSSQFSDESYWADQWKHKLAGYLAAPPRAGAMIHHALGDRVQSVLELGAGSCRDSLHLAEKGYRCVASDFNQETMRILESQFASERLRFSADDARALRFKDGEFDLVYHNGLIVCFESDSDVLGILSEQRRVARRYMLILVHNRENSRLVGLFKKLGESDSIYRIRFYSRGELAGLIDRAGIAYKRLKMLPFGGPADALYDKKVKGVWNPFRKFSPEIVPLLYRFQPWSRVERIACLLEL